MLTLLLAGGQGERLYPLTRDRAKPAVPFGGMYRIIDFTLSNCLNSGLRQVYVLTQYKSLSLENHIRRGWHLFNHALDEFIVPIPPQQRMSTSWYQGTGDAIYQNIYTLERHRPRHVLILSGDHVYKMDYAAMLLFHCQCEADLTVACIEVDEREGRNFGIASVDAEMRIRRFQEKPAAPATIPNRPGRCLASMGIYIFNTDILVRRVSEDAKHQTEHDFGKNIIPAMIDSDQVFAYPFRGESGQERPYWRDIGRIDAYYEANMDLCAAEPPFNLYDPDWPIWTDQTPAPPAKTVSAADQGYVVDSLICSGAWLAGGRVERSIISSYVRVDSFSEVRDSILMAGVQIGQHARVHRAIIDKDVRVPPGYEIGCDLDKDREHFTVTESGIVVVPKEMELPEVKSSHGPKKSTQTHPISRKT